MLRDYDELIELEEKFKLANKTITDRLKNNKS